MSNYLFIYCHETLNEPGLATQVALIEQLSTAGHSVRMLLVQNGVMMAREGVHSATLKRLIESHVSVVADTFSLAQREIPHTELKEHVVAGELSIAIDALLNGDKVIWN